MIRIQNIYYMLSYAFQVLNEQGYDNLASEKFENTADLLSAILAKGISIQIKRGLEREYVEKAEPLSCIRGKIDVSESIKNQTLIKQQLICNYDEFSIDAYFNRIIKTTVQILLRYDIPGTRKKELRNLMMYFRDVNELDWHTIDWNQRYDRNSQSYRMIISICYLIVKGLLQKDSKGNIKMQKMLDEQRMCRLYEKFILEYYRKEYKGIITANASQIPWQLDDGIDVMLPIMQTDIMLTRGEKVLIIDAKYYAHTTQTQYNTYTIHSGNLYQIFTYVKNKEIQLANQPHHVSGMLLYARTDEKVIPNNVYRMSGNQISVRTLNLDCEFDEVKKQLDGIVTSHFGISKDDSI